MQLLVDFVYTFRNFVNIYQQKTKRYSLHVKFFAGNIIVQE